MNKTDEDFVFLKLTFMREVDKKLQLRTINTLHHKPVEIKLPRLE